MSTRALIGIQNKSGKSIRFIYSHSDNYPKGVGMTLLNHYKSREKVTRLISNGNASFVAPRINPRKNRKHSFDYYARQQDVCVFYYRERGDLNQESGIAMSPKSFAKLDYGAEYYYYIDTNNVWWVCQRNEPFEKLKDLLIEKEISAKPKAAKKIIRTALNNKVDTSLGSPITFGPKLSIKSKKNSNFLGVH